ncbi:hypothetical protein Tco_1533287 [Tanacetum coccineum]
MDDALVAPENHLKIKECNQRLNPTLKSNEPTIQVALDALKLTPFYNAFVVSADVPEIYMQEFWATVKIHHFSLRFKMNGKSHTTNVDNFRDMLKVFPKLPGQKFKDPPFKEELLPFIRDLGHTENKNSKKNNDMFYPCFTKVTVDYFMAKDPSILMRNKMFWHTTKDDSMFTIIRVISKHQDTQIYGAILPQHLTNQAMLESEAYKTYRAYATGEKTPKPKSTKKKADSESSPKTKPTQASKGKRIKTSAKGVIPAKKKQSATKSKGLTVLSEVALTEVEQIKIALERSKTQQHSSHASSSGVDEGTGVTLGVPDVPSYDSEAEQISWKSSNKEDDDEVNMGNDNDDDDDNQDNDDQEHDGQDDEEQDDVNELTDSDNDGDNIDMIPKLSTHDEEDKEEEDSDPRVHTPSNYESTGLMMKKGRDTKMTYAPRTIIQTTQVIEDTNVIITLVNPEAQQQSSSVSSGFVSNMLNPSLDTGINSIFNLNTESTSLIDVPVTTIPSRASLSTTTLPTTHNLSSHILQQTKSNTRKTAPSSSLQDLPNFGPLFGLRDEAQAENANFLNKLNDNKKKIIKDQIKEQVKEQVSKILPKIEKIVNEQFEAEVLTRSSNESKTSHAVAANLSELELKKVLIDKMERNKSIHRSNEQKNLYKALVDAHESDKLILDTCGDNVSFKRHRDDEDKDEEPSAGSNWGSKRIRARKEPQSTSAPKEKTSKTTSKSTKGSKSHHKSAGESAQTLPDAHGPVQPWLSSLAQIEDPRESFNELIDTPLDFLAFMMKRLKVDTLTTELLADLTFELMKGSCKSLSQVPVSYDKHALWESHIGGENDNNSMDLLLTGNLLEMFIPNAETLLLRIQDIEDMLLLLVQGKRVEDLQLGVESYQKKLNLTKSDTYRLDLKQREAYIAYSNPRGFIYQNKDKKNRLIRIDKLHKFSDGTLNDDRTALDDRLKGIWMKYLP